MKFYKYTSGKCGYDYLHTGKVEVDPCDDKHGIVSLATQPWSEAGRSNGVILEFEVPDGLCLPRMVCTRNGDRVVQVDLSDCELIDSSHLYKLSDDFNLKTFIIGIDCQMRWQFARSWLKKMGKGDVAIKILRPHPDNGLARVDEEYRADDQGLYCLKWNPNHPDKRDPIRVEDVDCEAPCHCHRNERVEETKTEHLPRKLYKYTSAKYALEYLKTQKLKVATFEDVNDPNEWIPYAHNDADGSNYLVDPANLESFKKVWGGKWGFISFSSQMVNSILWAHYGDKFKGIVLEFEVAPDAPVFPVRYQPTRYIINKTELHKTGDRSQLQQFIAQKDVVWQHESEWRIISGLSQCSAVVTESGQTIYLSSLNPKIHLSGVVLGPRCPVKFGHVLTEVGESVGQELTLRRLAYDSLTYSMYVSSEYPAYRSELKNIRTDVVRTDVHTFVKQQTVQFSGNE